jgi:hypothetical protein
MKLRAWILAATIAAATGSLTAPTAQACVINPDGECLRSNTVRTQPAADKKTHRPTKPTTRPRSKPPLEP